MFAIAFSILTSTNIFAQQTRDPARLTHGPMLGNPTCNSVAVWARTSDASRFHVRFSTDETSLDQVSESAETKIEDDFTGTVALRGLKPEEAKF